MTEIIGDCTIHLGDAAELLPSIVADAVVTDPPYGILNLQGETLAIRKSPRSTGSGKLKNRLINTADFSWDSCPPSKEVIDQLLKIGKAQIIWGGNYFPLPPTRCVLVWDKMQPWENFSQVEIAWTSLDSPAQIFRWDKSRIDKQHPTQKPTELMSWCLKYVPDAETIFDPYMGSGTTAVSCVKAGRKFIGCEIEPKYFDIARKRIERVMGADSLFDPNNEPTNTTLFEEPTNAKTA